MAHRTGERANLRGDTDPDQSVEDLFAQLPDPAVP